MNIVVYVSQRIDADLFSLCMQGYQLNKLMRDAVIAYANFNQMHILIDEPIYYEKMDDIKNFRISVTIPDSEKATISLLKMVDTKNRPLFVKTIFRDSLVHQNIYCFLDKNIVPPKQLSKLIQATRSVDTNQNLKCLSQFPKKPIKRLKKGNLIDEKEDTNNSPLTLVDILKSDEILPEFPVNHTPITERPSAPVLQETLPKKEKIDMEIEVGGNSYFEDDISDDEIQTDSEFDIDNTDDEIQSGPEFDIDITDNEMQSEPEFEYEDGDETPLVDDELDPALFGDFLDNID